MEHRGWALGLQGHPQVWFLPVSSVLTLLSGGPYPSGWSAMVPAKPRANPAEESECLFPPCWQKTVGMNRPGSSALLTAISAAVQCGSCPYSTSQLRTTEARRAVTLPGPHTQRAADLGTEPSSLTLRGPKAQY